MVSRARRGMLIEQKILAISQIQVPGSALVSALRQRVGTNAGTDEEYHKRGELLIDEEKIAQWYRESADVTYIITESDKSRQSKYLMDVLLQFRKKGSFDNDNRMQGTITALGSDVGDEKIKAMRIFRDKALGGNAVRIDIHGGKTVDEYTFTFNLMEE